MKQPRIVSGVDKDKTTYQIFSKKNGMLLFEGSRKECTKFLDSKTTGKHPYIYHGFKYVCDVANRSLYGFKIRTKKTTIGIIKNL